jgi:photosystem II stability/assembly factor-like uncharacterized protein
MKMLILLISFVISLNIVNAQWQTIYKDSIQYQFFCVHFLNNDTGFVGGWKKYNPNYGGIIFRTYNGGISWDTTYVMEIVLDIHFINDTIGFAGGDYGVVYATYDGGDNWIYKGGAFFSSDVSSIYFKDSLDGFKLNMCLGLYKTTDGGLNWQLYLGLNINSYWPGNSRFRFPSHSTGFLIAGGGGGSNCMSAGIAKTTDGADTWYNLTIPINFYPYSAHFFDTLSGIVVGRHGMISTTTDGGRTWVVPYSISQYNLYDIEFVTDSIGYIIGGSNPNDQWNGPYRGLIYKTIDKGLSWQMIDSSYNYSLNKLQFTSDSIGYIAGQNGEILKITNANSLFTSVQTILSPNENFNVYPNPAFSFINLTLDIPGVVKIFDIYGRLLLEETYSSGEIKIDINDLHEGFYIVKTEENSVKFIKK